MLRVRARRRGGSAGCSTCGAHGLGDVRRWVDRDWYRYLRYRFGRDKLLVSSLLALPVLAVGGALTMRSLAGNSPRPTAYVPLTKTVMRRIKVVEHGKTMYKRVPTIKRIYARPVTVQNIRTISAPSGTQVVAASVVRYKPVYKRQVVLVDGKRVTVVHVLTDTQTLTDTQVLTITDEHTVTSQQQQTVKQTQTINRTQTVNQTVTNVRTETLPTETVTGPTRTSVVTTTVQSTVTVTRPTATITVTVTRPDD